MKKLFVGLCLLATVAVTAQTPPAKKKEAAKKECAKPKKCAKLAGEGAECCAAMSKTKMLNAPKK